MQIQATTVEKLEEDSVFQLEVVKLIHRSFFNDPLKRYFACAPTHRTDIKYFDIHDPSQIPLMEQYCKSINMDPIDYSNYFEKSYWWEFVITMWRSDTIVETIRDEQSGRLIAVSFWKTPTTSPPRNVENAINKYYVTNAGQDCFDRVQEYWRSASSGDKPECYYLGLIAVDPDFQRRGVMKHLLKKWIEKSEQDNLPLILDTESAANVPIYERCGFKTLRAAEIATWRPTYGDHDEVVYVYIMQRDPHPDSSNKSN